MMNEPRYMTLDLDRMAREANSGQPHPISRDAKVFGAGLVQVIEQLGAQAKAMAMDDPNRPGVLFVLDGLSGMNWKTNHGRPDE